MDGTRDDASLDAHADTAPQPVMTPEALAEAAERHRHERLHGAHAATAAVTSVTSATTVTPPPVHHHEAEGGHASHLAPHHAAEPPSSRRRAVVAGSLAAVLLLVGSVAAWAALRPSGTTAAPQPSATPTASQTVGASDVDPTAAPGAPAAPLLPPGQATLVLGDSLGLTVYPWLADLVRDRYVSYEAEVGRTTTQTLDQLRGLSSIPPMVIVSSGTNDPTAAGLEADAVAILDLLGPERCVVWVDIVRPDSAYDSAADLNAALARAAEGRANVSILQWSTLIETNPDWMGGDGIHPSEAGAIGRADAFAGASQACSPTDPDAPTAKKQYIPLSAFYGPIAGGGTGSGTGTGTGTTSTARPVATSSAPQPAPTDDGGGEATVSPDPAPSTSEPATTSAPPPPPPPPPPTSAAPQETQPVAAPAPSG